ncbi:MAG: pro-sigmaK processing inhibitor BofA family protein [Oscillospiraceae bacterium]|jgi:inhibitor of the pro-sigma K processing machinery
MSLPFFSAVIPAAVTLAGGAGIGLVVICILLLVLFIKLLAKPLKWVIKFLLNALAGFIALILINFVGGFFGFSLTVNFLNCLIAGCLGMPGVILLILIKYLF